MLIESRSVVAVEGWGWKAGRRGLRKSGQRDYKEAQRNFRDNGYAHYLYCCDDFKYISVYVFQLYHNRAV